ncbi:glutathione S-transferase family protein [Vibrio nigripulchritudo]|uniref:glutathione S-transferase family protein n=1 Tax=Vibrio nigripulchritudo TaxID=28173 RepID=UPI0003B1DA0B|nr:glutathione S-transferase [Vibrio nigripulchritudo]CCN69614.1 Glutathione S-transferase 2 [Vibrio nigripulchritudo SFn118]
MSKENEITVYETTGFPNPARIRAALAEKNALSSVTFVEVDVMNKEHRTESFYAKNPLGTVPVMKTAEGEYLSESTAITEYIDHHFDGPSLTGSSAIERGRIHMMQRRAESMVMDAVGAWFHHGTEGLGPDLEVNPCPEWGQKQHAVATEGMRYFNEVLSKSTYVAGEGFSMADITLFYGLAFADFASVAIPTEYHHLIEWRERMAKRPSLAS